MLFLIIPTYQRCIRLDATYRNMVSYNYPTMSKWEQLNKLDP